MALDIGVTNIKSVERFEIRRQSVAGVGQHITVVSEDRDPGLPFPQRARDRVARVKAIDRDIIAAQIDWPFGDHRGAGRGTTPAGFHADAPSEVSRRRRCRRNQLAENESELRRGRHGRRDVTGGKNHRRIDGIDGDLAIAVGCDATCLVIEAIVGVLYPTVSGQIGVSVIVDLGQRFLQACFRHWNRAVPAKGSRDGQALVGDEGQVTRQRDGGYGRRQERHEQGAGLG